jgi:hypothetical protein
MIIEIHIFFFFSFFPAFLLKGDLSSHLAGKKNLGSLTLVTTFNFLPWLYSDLATALSMRWMVLVSSSWANQTYISLEKLWWLSRRRCQLPRTPEDDKISIPERW